MKRLLIAWLITISMLGGMAGAFQAVAQETGPEATISALQTQVAELESGDEPTPTPASASATESKVASPAEVNLEIILDVSGSMAQYVDSGETRLEAAKRVLNEVLAQVPQEPGVNVGLRIYGHLGDNTEAGRPASCIASDLVVPISGVNRDTIAAQLAPLFPTGWTPIGLSLDRSVTDFASSSPDATNAVILVTDGLETCGGDPVASAANLLTSDQQIVTHVIGFAVTPDEQAILQGITGASGGLLLGASNASELSSALFSVLEELEIIVGNGYIGGNAFSLIPAGEAGVVSVVAYGPPNPFSSAVPIVVRNNTDADVYGVEVTATLLDSSGRVVATGNDQGIDPFHLQPGTLGIGHIYFDGIDLPPDAGLEFHVDQTPSDELRYTHTRDVEIIEASIFEDRVVGRIGNPQEATIEGTIGLTLVCFDSSGIPTYDAWEFVQSNTFAPGDELPFQATVSSLQSQGCPIFLVAGNGQCDACPPINTGLQTPQSSSAKPTSANSSATDEVVADSADRFAPDPLPGVSGGVLRSFRYVGGNLSDIIHIPYALLHFNTAEEADAALEETAIRYFEQRDEPLDNLMPQSAPNIGDRAIFYAGTAPNDQFDITLAVLAVRAGSDIHFLIGTRIDGDPSDLMVEVATVGVEMASNSMRVPIGDATTGLNAGGLWDKLPLPEELGENFIVVEEFVPKMFGPLNDQSSDATPSP